MVPLNPVPAWNEPENGSFVLVSADRAAQSVMPPTDLLEPTTSWPRFRSHTFFGTAPHLPAEVSTMCASL